MILSNTKTIIRETFQRYNSVLCVPYTRLLVFAAFSVYLARFATTLVMIFLVHGATGSFAIAGAVAAGRAMGAMIFAPIRGKLVDHFGQTIVLIPLSVIHVIALISLTASALSAPNGILLIILAGIAGATFPPLFACMRSLWSVMFRSDPRLGSAYALEAVLQDLSLIGGPLLAGGLIILASPALALVVIAAIILIGVLMFATTPVSRAWRGERRTVGHAGALASSGMRTLVASMVFIGAAAGTIEVGIPAFVDDRGSSLTAGVLLALVAAGSIVGGLLYGSREWQQPVGQQYLILLAIFTISLAPLPIAGSSLLMALFLTIAGIAIAPIFICSYQLLDELAPTGTSTEAFTWMTSAQFAGTAVGSAMTGAIIEAIGIKWALLGGCVSTAFGLIIVLAWRPYVVGCESNSNNRDNLT